MNGNIPHMYDSWADPVIRLLQLKSFIEEIFSKSEPDCVSSISLVQDVWL